MENMPKCVTALQKLKKLTTSDLQNLAYQSNNAGINLTSKHPPLGTPEILQGLPCPGMGLCFEICPGMGIL